MEESVAERPKGSSRFHKSMAERITWCPAWYPCYTDFITADSSFYAYRRFASLRARILLQQQWELHILEEKLDEMDKMDEKLGRIKQVRIDEGGELGEMGKMDERLGRIRQARIDEGGEHGLRREELLGDIERKLKQYSELLEQYYQKVDYIQPRNDEILGEWGSLVESSLGAKGYFHNLNTSNWDWRPFGLPRSRSTSLLRLLYLSCTLCLASSLIAPVGACMNFAGVARLGHPPSGGISALLAFTTMSIQGDQRVGPALLWSVFGIWAVTMAAFVVFCCYLVGPGQRSLYILCSGLVSAVIAALAAQTTQSVARGFVMFGPLALVVGAYVVYLFFVRVMMPQQANGNGQGIALGRVRPRADGLSATEDGSDRPQ